MSKANESAFPRPINTNQILDAITPKGLSKRELFAAMAMQGLIHGQWRLGEPQFNAQLAPLAVEYADALLKELEKETK